MWTQGGGILSAYLLQEVIVELNVKLWVSTTLLEVGYGISLVEERASLIARLVKNSPAMQETSIWFLDREDPLEKG